MKKKIINDVHEKLNGKVSHGCIEAVLKAANYFEVLEKTKKVCDRMYSEQSKLEVVLRKCKVPLG